MHASADDQRDHEQKCFGIYNTNTPRDLENSRINTRKLGLPSFVCVVHFCSQLCILLSQLLT